MPRYEATGSTEGLLGPDDDDDDMKTRVADMPRIEPPTNPKQTVLGLGTPQPPLPSFGAAPPEMLDYGAEDEEAVTTVLSPPSEAEDPPTISTVHEPAKKQIPQYVPDDKIVVAPTLLMPDEQRTALGGSFSPMGGAMTGMGPQPPMHTGHASVTATGAPQQGGLPKDARSVLIALIAAATTLIALALTALVILKLVEKPAEQPPVATTVTAGRGTITPTPPPTPKIITTAESPPTPTPAVAEKPREESGTLKPEELPKEAKPSGKGVTAAGTTAPKPGPGPAPVDTSSKSSTPAATGPGYLTVMCDPACDGVSAGGRNLGPSPVVRAALPPGNHGVTLRRSGSPTKSISVQIVSGQTTARRVKM